jgi:hypothetical protein
MPRLDGIYKTTPDSLFIVNYDEERKIFSVADAQSFAAALSSPEFQAEIRDAAKK